MFSSVHEITTFIFIAMRTETIGRKIEKLKTKGIDVKSQSHLNAKLPRITAVPTFAWTLVICSRDRAMSNLRSPLP